MLHIKKFNEFDSNKKLENIKPVNEFFGGLLKKLFSSIGNKISLKFSKKIGGAGDADKAIDKYSDILFGFLDKQLALEEDLIKYELNKDKSGASDMELETKREEMNKQLSLINKQKKSAKETFNISINNIIKNEKDPNIKNYIQLSRAELSERILAKELEELQRIGGNKLDKDKKFRQRIDRKERQLQKSADITSKIGDKLSNELNNTDSTDNEEYKQGDKVKYTMSEDNGGGENTAEVMKQDGVGDDMIKLKTEKSPDGFEVEKKKVTGKV